MNTDTKPTRRRRKVKNSEILEWWGETLGSSFKKEQTCRSRSLDEWRSCSSSSARWLSGMRGDESPAPPTATASRFIGELEARLPSEEEWRSSAMLRLGMEFVRSISFSFHFLSLSLNWETVWSEWLFLFSYQRRRKQRFLVVGESHVISDPPPSAISFYSFPQPATLSSSLFIIIIIISS